ncbi:MAG: 16S rRNA (uracil(1498)-N(3))-methyltransferase [Akkermansiaceae bacterium]
MNRYYIPAGEWEDASLTLTADEARHCARVMRARVGEKVEIFDGEGKSAQCEIKSLSRDQVICTRLSTHTQEKPAHPITLCQAIPKGGNMELIVQKSVELGVSRIQPLITAHTIARSEDHEKKRAKWQRIALEASKQCGQNRLPVVETVLSFKSWLASKPNYSTSIVAALDDKAVHLKTHFAEKPAVGSIALLVGPEGDFSAEEYQAAYELGFSPISFGGTVMRVETATMYGLSILQHELR